MTFLEIHRRWFPQSEIAAWDDFPPDLARRFEGKKSELAESLRQRGWALDLEGEPFIELGPGSQVRPGEGGRFRRRDIENLSAADVRNLQLLVDPFREVVSLRDIQAELPAALNLFKREYEGQFENLRAARSRASVDEALAKARDFYKLNESALPAAARREFLGAEQQILQAGFNTARSENEAEHFRQELLAFFRRHREATETNLKNKLHQWENEFIHQEEFQNLLKAMRQAATLEEVDRAHKGLDSLLRQHGDHLRPDARSEAAAARDSVLQSNFPPSLPAGLKAMASSGDGISIMWDKSSGAAQYLVYRGDSRAVESRSPLRAIDASAASTHSFLDTAAEPGKEYFYWITAKNAKAESDYVGPVLGKRMEQERPRADELSTACHAEALNASKEGDVRRIIKLCSEHPAHFDTLLGLLKPAWRKLANDLNAKINSMSPEELPALHQDLEDIERRLQDLGQRDAQRIPTISEYLSKTSELLEAIDARRRRIGLAEAEAKAREEASLKAKAQQKALQEIEAKRIAEEQAKAEAEAKAREAARLKAEAEQKALEETEAKRLADEKAKAKATAEAEAKARNEDEAAKLSGKAVPPAKPEPARAGISTVPPPVERRPEPPKTVPLVAAPRRSGAGSRFRWPLMASALVVLAAGILAFYHFSPINPQPSVKPKPKDESPPTPAPVPGPIPVSPSVPTTGGLVIQSDPTGAGVYSNGQKVGLTPYAMSGLPAGQLAYQLGTLTHTGMVVAAVAAGLTNIYKTSLTPRRGALVINSDPPNAEVWVDGQRNGTTPVNLQLDAGERQVTLKHPPLADVYAPLLVTADGVCQTNISFAYGGVEIISEPPGAAVSWHGETAGITPFSTNLLVPGSTAFQLSLRNYVTSDFTIQVPGDHRLAMARIELQPIVAQAGQRWTNSLGMRFAPVAGTQVLFGVWDVRVKDFAVFARDVAGNGGWDYRKGQEPYILKSDGWKQRGWDYGWQNPGFAQTGEHPVTCVSWEDATNFCHWLTQKERSAGMLANNQSYRLPADSEWSTAVGPQKFPWGDTMPPPDGAGNYAGPEAADADWPTNFAIIKEHHDAFARTSPVGSFAPNAFGLFDMGGNVWQWCEDWYRKDMNSSEAQWDDGGGMTFRVLRGASWSDDDPVILSSGYRSGCAPGRRFGIYGFRCVLVVGGVVR